MRAESGIDPCRKEDYLSEEEFAKARCSCLAFEVYSLLNQCRG